MPTIATFEQIEQTANYLLSRIDENTALGAVVTLLYRCGLRIEEAVELKRFTLEALTFTIDTEKKSYNRTFNIALLPSAYYPKIYNPPAIPALWVISSKSSVSRFILQNSPYVFYKEDKKITTNVFRYFYARNLQEQGYTVEQIQQAMGHSNIASTLSYLAPIFVF